MPTKLDGMQFSEGLERIGQVMDRGTLIRTAIAADLGSILHSRHQYHWHTGYEPPQTVAAPHMGAWIAQALGPRNPAVPAYIDIGQRYDERRVRRTEGLSDRRRAGERIWPVPCSRPQRRRGQRASAGRHDVGRFQNRYQAYRQLVAASPVAATAAITSRSRCCGRWKMPIGC